VSGSGYSNDALLGTIIDAPNIGATDNYSIYKYSGLFGRISYIWDSKYIINFSGRRDGSSRFGPGRQFGNFGSVGGGWIFSEEPLIKNDIPVLSFGKLRATYGTTGTDNVGDYQYLSNWHPMGDSYQGTVGYYPQNLYAPNYHWAVNKKLELGLDLGFLKDRVLLSGLWFRNRCGNQLTNYILPIQTGFNSITANFPALVQNAGWEFTMRTTNIKTKRFNWNSSLNLSIERNKLIGFPGIETSPYSQTYYIGKSLSTQHVYQYLDVNPTTGLFEFASKSGATSNPPDLTTGNPTDHTTYVNPSPKFYGGLSNTISYKGLSLNFFLQFSDQTGLNYLGQVYQGGNSVGNAKNQPVAMIARWQRPGDKTAIQQFTTQSGLNSNNASSAAYFFSASSGQYSDASYIRLKTLSLSYALPGNCIKKIKLQGCSLFVNAQNLFTLTHYLGSDPETQSLYGVPPMKTVVAGIQINL
jgi:TonB-dependent starch-binding outer membrane protein SusC